MKLILDLDTGIDDAMALAYAVGHPDAEVIGVTSVFGNVETEQGVKNASAILKLIGREDIPVFKGATHKLTDTEDYVQEEASGIFHGRNGLGNIDLEPGNNISDDDAIDFIIESAKKYGDDLTFVTTGPLSNAALAIQKDPEAMKQLHGIVSMGGALTVPGNVSIVAEANFNKDAEADNIVFDSGLPVTMVGLDVTLQTLLTENDIAPWEHGTEAEQAFFKFVTYYFKAYDGAYDELAGCALHDPLAVSVALDPNWVKGDTFRLRALTDDEQYGRIVQNLPALAKGEEENVRVALHVDPEAYDKHFLETINNALQK